MVKTFDLLLKGVDSISNPTSIEKKKTSTIKESEKEIKIIIFHHKERKYSIAVFLPPSKTCTLSYKKLNFHSWIIVLRMEIKIHLLWVQLLHWGLINDEFQAQFCFKVPIFRPLDIYSLGCMRSEFYKKKVFFLSLISKSLTDICGLPILITILSWSLFSL